MRKFLLTSAVLLTFPVTAHAGTITARVNGLVCAFCATSIEKTFEAQPAVDTVTVDLETKLVTIATKKGQDMKDEDIARLITEAGYTVIGIERKDDHAPAQ